MADISKWYAMRAPSTAGPRTASAPGDDQQDAAFRADAVRRLTAEQAQRGDAPGLDEGYYRDQLAQVNMRGDQNLDDAYGARDNLLRSASQTQMAALTAAYQAGLDQKIAEWIRLHPEEVVTGGGGGGGGGGGRGRGGGGGGGSDFGTTGGPTAADFGAAAFAGAAYGAGGIGGAMAPKFKKPVSAYPVEAPPGAERTLPGAGKSAKQMGAKSTPGYGWKLAPVKAKVKVGAS